MPIGSLRGKDPETAAAPDPVDAEVPPVGGEDQVGVQLFGEDDQGGVGVVHGQVGVLPHELAAASEGRAGRRHQECAAGQEEVHARLSPSREPSEQVGRFRQDGFSAGDRPVPIAEEPRAGLVTGLASIEERYQRPRVEEQLTGHGGATR